MKSKYVFRQVGTGPTQLAAFEDYRRAVQQPQEWRAVAVQILPSLISEITEEQIQNPLQLWLKLSSDFSQAYKTDPYDYDLIERIYAFAIWCELQEHLSDVDSEYHLPTCVISCFYEDIPQSPRALRDMPRWFTPKEIDSLPREYFEFLIDDFHGFRKRCE
jgi:hypothetical protein